MEKVTNNTTVLYLYTKLQKILEQAGTDYIINIIKKQITMLLVSLFGNSRCALADLLILSQ